MAQARPPESDVVLRDGSTVHVRDARPDDQTRVENYLIGLSPETRHLRFGSASIDVREVAAKAVAAGGHDHVTLLALGGPDRVVGGAQYLRLDGVRAEISVSVTDEMQGKGLGSILIGQLAQRADEHGITTFVANVLPENHAMINVFRESGFNVSIRAQPGEIEVEFPTSLTEEAIQHFDEREAMSAISAMTMFLSPAAVAVVGASRDPESVGGRLFHNLIEGEFRGAVYPVNPNADVVHGVAAHHAIADVPGPVDVAFIVVPAGHVAAVARECAEAGVRGLVVISAGFAETGGDGPARQEELVRVCRESGMRLIGPNCMGIVNTDPEIGLNGTFGAESPPVGSVGFLSQSGALGLAVMEHASRLGVGLSSFVSVGNKGDVSGNDLLCFWEEDARTDVILLYLESFANPRRFARLSRRIGRRKPIVTVKSGRSAAGARAAASHTGVLLAASDVTVDALFRQAGVVRTDTLEEMLDVATLLAHQPVPKGERVAIVTNAGGLGILCADTCEAHGLTVPPLAEETVAELRSFLSAEASVSNPVDMVASAGAEDYGRAIRTVGNDPGIDALILLYVPAVPTLAGAIAGAILDAATELDGRVPVLTTFMSAKGVPAELRSDRVRVPSFAFPEQAAIALSKAAHYGAWRGRPEGSVPAFPDARPDEAAGILASGLSGESGWLDPEDVERLLSCYGLPVVHARRVRTREEAGAAAVQIAGPVALKGVGPLHKREAGAVRLGLSGSGEVERAAREIAESVEHHGERLDGFVVQPMVEDGVEMLVGVVHDPLFGPLVAVGAGGTAVELLKDVEVRITPITDLDASEMIHSLQTFPLLDGYAGAPRADVSALEDVLLRVGTLVENHPEIAEMDCNPVTVTLRGALVVDARVRVESHRPVLPIAARPGPPQRPR